MKKLLIILLLFAGITQAQDAQSLLLFMSKNLSLLISYDKLSSFSVDLLATVTEADSTAFFLNDNWVASFSNNGKLSYHPALNDTTTYIYKAIAYSKKNEITKNITFTTYTGFYFITSTSDTLKTNNLKYFRTSRY